MKNLFTLLLLAVSVLTARAIPAFPYPQTITQPDGSSVTIVMHGDENFNYATTIDGYTVTWNQEGCVVYAKIENNEIKPTGIVAHDAGSRTASDKEYLRSVGKTALPATGSIEAAIASHKAPRHKLSTWDISKFHGLVVLVQFKDRPFLYSNTRELFNNMINGDGYTGYYDSIHSKQVDCTGSVHDYFNENSKGNFAPYFDVVGPVVVDYAQTSPQQANYASSIFTAALKQVDSTVDYSKYDTNGDGVVDMVYFIVSGGGSHAGNNSRYLWPHASIFSGLRLDGVSFGRYACSTELYGLESQKQLDGIGTICHEFSHVLGLDDHYDVDYATSGYSSHPNHWDLMAAGSYNGESRTPAGYNLYERWALGWSTPQVVESRGVRKVYPLQESNAGYRINSQLTDEYFLIENRQATRWDAALPGNGLLVWRVDSTSATAWTSNKVNNNPDHNYFELVRAAEHDTIVTSGVKSYTLAVDGKWDPFPGSAGVDSLVNATSKPHINSWTGLKTEWTLKNIKTGNGYMTFNAVRDPISTYVETFETMPLTTADTTGMQGTFSKWDFTKAIVAEPEAGWCDGTKAAGLLKGGDIHTTVAVNEAVNTMSFNYYNPTSSAAVVRCYYSTNGGTTWTNAKTYSGTTYLRVNAQSASEGEFQIGTTEPVLLKISLFSGSSSSYSYVDNVTVKYESHGDDDTLEGDVNADGTVDVSDVTSLINKVLGLASYDDAVCDINTDGDIDVSDVTALVNLVLSSKQ